MLPTFLLQFILETLPTAGIVTRNQQLKDNLDALKDEIDGPEATRHGPSAVFVINYGEARSYTGERTLKDFISDGVFSVFTPLHVADGVAVDRKRDVLHRYAAVCVRQQKSSEIRKQFYSLTTL
jgi:hypothetical protein